MKIYHNNRPASQEFKDAFEGWTIESVGMTQEYQVIKDRNDDYAYSGYVEGGLTFILVKDNTRKQVILGYTELGEWIEDEEIL
jgi:hypothetical protein